MGEGTAEAAPMKSVGNRIAGSAVIEQDHGIGIEHAMYDDNEPEVVLAPMENDGQDGAYNAGDDLPADTLVHVQPAENDSKNQDVQYKADLAAPKKLGELLHQVAPKHDFFPEGCRYPNEGQEAQNGGKIAFVRVEHGEVHGLTCEVGDGRDEHEPPEEEQGACQHWGYNKELYGLDLAALKSKGLKGALAIFDPTGQEYDQGCKHDLKIPG